MLHADAYSFYFLLKDCLRGVGREGRGAGGNLKEFNANLLSGVYEGTGNDASSTLTTMVLLLN